MGDNDCGILQVGKTENALYFRALMGIVILDHDFVNAD